MGMSGSSVGPHLELLDSANDDYDLATGANVYQGTPSTTEALRCQIVLLVGDGTKNLDASGGDFELTLTLGSNVAEPGPQTIACGTNARSAFETAQFTCPANTQVTANLKSPNGDDDDVDVTAYLYRLPS